MRGGEYLLASKTLDQVNSTLVKHIVGNHPNALRKGYPGGYLYVGDVSFRIHAGGTKGADEGLKGRELQGAFLDELTNLQKDYYDQTLSRCSEGAPGKIVCCTNPDGPTHWVKEIIDSAADDPDIEEYSMTIDSNPSLTEKFKEGLRKRYTGVWLERYYFGRWAAAEGAIYPMISQCVAKPPDGPPRAVWLAGDWGDSDPTHFVRIEEHSDRVRYITREWRWGNEAGYIDDGEKARLILDQLGAGPITGIHVDPSAISIIEELRRRTPAPVKGAVNDVMTGLQQTRAMFDLGRLKIDGDACPETYNELAMYRWRESTMAGANTQPDHEFSHSADAVRYHCASTLREDWFFSEEW